MLVLLEVNVSCVDITTALFCRKDYYNLTYLGGGGKKEENKLQDIIFTV